MSDIVSQELPTVLFPFHRGWHAHVWACAYMSICTRTSLRLIGRLILNCSSTVFQDVGFGIKP